MTGGRARREHPHHEAPALHEPPVRDGGGEHKRHRACADANQQAPEDQQLPRRGHEHATGGAERNKGERDGDNLADTEAIHERGRERRDEAVEHEVDAHGERHDARRPAELLAERNHKRPWCGSESGCRQQGHKRDGCNPPGRMHAESAFRWHRSQLVRLRHALSLASVGRRLTCRFQQLVCPRPAGPAHPHGECWFVGRGTCIWRVETAARWPLRALS